MSKLTLEFNLPEDQQEFKDYQDGLKCKYFLHQWLQDYKRVLEMNKVTGWECFDALNKALEDENIEIFD